MVLYLKKKHVGTVPRKEQIFLSICISNWQDLSSSAVKRKTYAVRAVSLPSIRSLGTSVVPLYVGLSMNTYKHVNSIGQFELGGHEAIIPAIWK